MASTKPDAIIVGAGHNSLACAVHLISKGWTVQIVEKAEIAADPERAGEGQGRPASASGVEDAFHMPALADHGVQL